MSTNKIYRTHISFDKLIQDWYDSLCGHYTLATIQGYQTVARTFRNKLGKSPTNATKEEVEAFVLCPRLSRRTKGTYKSSLSSFYKYLVSSGIRLDNPLDNITVHTSPEEIYVPKHKTRKYYKDKVSKIDRNVFTLAPNTQTIISFEDNKITINTSRN